MKLYELTGKYNQLLEMAESVDPETLADTLESLEDSINSKVENTAKVIRSLESDNEAIANEIKRLEAMKKTRANNIARLKDYLKEQMEVVGADKIQGELFTVRLQFNPEKLVVTDETMLTQYFIQPEPKLDTRAVKEALKAGEELQGAELVRERSLRIK